MSLSRRLKFERLERREMLSVNWSNRGTIGNDTDSFESYYGTNNAVVARSIVDRAIDGWNKMITDFHYVEDNDSDPNNDLDNEFHLTVLAEELTNDRRDSILLDDMDYNAFGVPKATTIRLDNDGGGAPGPGWFFDETPTDDIEFTGISSPFAASFVDVNGQIGFNN